jgi:TonB family protein
LILLPAALVLFNAIAADSACVSIDTPSTGTIKQVAVAKLLRFGSHTPIPDGFASFVVDAIATHLVLPKPLALGVYGARVMASKGSTVPSQMAPTFSSEFFVVFRHDGSVKGLAVSQQSLAPALDAAITRAIHVADSTLSFPPIDEATDKSTLSVIIDFDVVDSARSGSYPVFRVTVPLYPATRLSSQLRTDTVPRYADELRSQGIPGGVTLRFVIDETGKVADRSYRFAEPSEIPFGEAALAVLPRLRYEPARIGNCAVKQLVQESFIGAGTAKPTNEPYFEFQVEKPVRLIPGLGSPLYPDVLRFYRVEGEVQAQFVVNEDGTAELGSFRVLKATDDLFASAVRAALPQMRFYPAEVDGKRVRQLVQQSFQFKLGFLRRE